MNKMRPYSKRTSEPRPTPHGTLTGYTNDGCRCDDCTCAMKIYQRNRRAKKAAQL